jgi:hypothetical protein
MKNSSSLLIVLWLLSGSGIITAQANTSTIAPQKGLDILSSPGLYGLVSGWANEYSRVDPSVSISVRKAVGGQPDIEFSEEPAKTSAWKMIIGHNAIVPVIN